MRISGRVPCTPRAANKAAATVNDDDDEGPSHPMGFWAVWLSTSACLPCAMCAVPCWRREWRLRLLSTGFCKPEWQRRRGSVAEHCLPDMGGGQGFRRIWARVLLCV